MKRDIVVVGGATYDITGRLLGAVKNNDSNPSNIYAGCGGVGRNVAENSARIGLRTSFITVWGDDAFSDQLRESCQVVGIDTSHGIVKKNANPCVYIDLLDQQGELILAASDLTTLENQPADIFSDSIGFINQHRLLCLDANLIEDQLISLATRSDTAIICDTVSISKAPRIKAILYKLDAVKTNIGELCALMNRKLNTPKSIEEAGIELLNTGVKKVFITMGNEGACCVERSGTVWINGHETIVNSVTGAGDAFCAGIAYGILNDLSTMDTLVFSTAMSHMALQSPNTVNDKLTRQQVIKAADSLKAGYM